MIRRLVNPPFSGSRLVSRPFWARVGRVLLFTTALGISPYLPVLFVDDLTEPQYTIALVASLYPALMVIWGFWKGHLVLGWLLLWIQLSFFLFWVVYMLSDSSRSSLIVSGSCLHSLAFRHPQYNLPARKQASCI